MHFSDIRKYDIANGDGVRTSLFVSGCRNHCPGCFNAKTQDFDYGTLYEQKHEDELIENLKSDHICGLSILGGEPMEEENQPFVLKLVDRAKRECPNKTIFMWTGYVFDQDLMTGQRKHINGVTDKILEKIDVIVDGPFVLEKKSLMLKWRGSSNQRIIDVNHWRKTGKIKSLY